MEEYRSTDINPFCVNERTFALTFGYISDVAKKCGLEATFTTEAWVRLANVVQKSYRRHGRYPHAARDREPSFRISFVRFMYCTMLWGELFPRGGPLVWHIAPGAEYETQALRRQFSRPEMLFRALGERDPAAICEYINGAFHDCGSADDELRLDEIRHNVRDDIELAQWPLRCPKYDPEITREEDTDSSGAESSGAESSVVGSLDSIALVVSTVRCVRRRMCDSCRGLPRRASCSTLALGDFEL